ncbi:MAG: hypothetical protein HC933_10990 [Pleurocapsa sp. SU_196_0]|nr:hypothetical protein [Pleurocapsa sp. SU_196_0]
MIAQSGRIISALNAEPSPLHFVTAGEPRVEILRGTPGTDLAGDSVSLKFSSTGTSGWFNSVTIGGSGRVFVRYTPQAAVTVDRVRPLTLLVDSVQHHAEALELTGMPTESQHTRELLTAIPTPYRDDSDAIVAVAKTMAWLLYPSRVLISRHDALHNPTLTPSQHLEKLRVLLGLPEMRDLPVPIRRSLCANANAYYADSGLTRQLEELITIFTGVVPQINGTGVHQLELRLSGLPVNEETFKRQVQFWMPAWVVWTAFFGYYYDGEIFYDGVNFYDGVSA